MNELLETLENRLKKYEFNYEDEDNSFWQLTELTNKMEELRWIISQIKSLDKK